MKIGQVTVSYKPIRGGAEVYLDNLSKVLEEEGHKVRVYQPDTGIKEEKLLLSSNPDQPSGVRRVFPRLMRYNLSLFLEQRKNLRKEDLLIVHYPEHYPAVFWHKKNVVLTHGINWDFDTGLRRWQRETLAKIAFKYSWRFVANDTNFLRAMGVDIKPGEKMFEEVLPGRYFIPNCVDTEKFQKTTGIESLKKLNCIVVPRNLSKPRGVDLAVAAFEKIAEKVTDLSLVIVGSSLPVTDSQEFGEELLKKVKNSKFSERIIFLGSKGWEEMPDIYSSALLTVIPTRGNEGTSLSALESMSCGTATLTTGVAGLLDLPSEQVNTNVNDIAQGILKVLDNKDAISQKQQKLVREKFNLKNWKKAWLEVIN